MWGAAGRTRPAAIQKRSTNLSIKALLASVLVAFSVMAGGASAFAANASPTGEYDSYPTWAQKAFESDGGQ